MRCSSWFSSGIGACIVPTRIPDKLLADYGLRNFAFDATSLRRRVVAITPSGKTPSRLTSALLDCAMHVA